MDYFNYPDDPNKEKERSSQEHPPSPEEDFSPSPPPDEGHREIHASKPSTNWTAMILTGVISALLAALLVGGSLFGLLQAGVISSANQGNKEEVTTKKEELSVDVNSDIIKAVEKVRPAVVGILNFSGPSSGAGEVQGTGSGVVFYKEGDTARVVTNAHVIKDSSYVEVVFMNDSEEEVQRVEAKVLGADQNSDLAVLEIPSKYVSAVAEFGDSDALKAGEPAIAIGNPLGLEFSQSVTVGVVSAPHRSFEIEQGMLTMDVIQTDAAINPGNSGGALVNTAGQVIGINSIKISLPEVEGMGFAIPSKDAEPLISNLIEYGRVVRPYIGIIPINVQSLSQYQRSRLNLPDEVVSGVVVNGVQSGSPASKAGLKRLDVIVGINGTTIDSIAELRNHLQDETKVGEKINITLYRNGEKKSASLSLVEAKQ
ncbi:S1C family serine protease [Mechercharimyces sp. CAU 1602]|uniref:S1C family serine protease n=1 Tax=Mechercharimyces sp. CAU 1602 TaxID=2973933 RepID=UPI0021627FCB|nr:trypsin-like peptidase domain-containing protein [Mechercharimyces sp. CAU 1602]MCS1352663.1 trypsin-like peptidase domain-containing protein [Mechercharimyces sp. CAU 1602]